MVSRTSRTAARPIAPAMFGVPASSRVGNSSEMMYRSRKTSSTIPPPTSSGSMSRRMSFRQITAPGDPGA